MQKKGLMGLQLVTLRSWLIERVRIMPAPLLVLVFMILINIHQSGIKNQVSEGFHDLKIILNILNFQLMLQSNAELELVLALEAMMQEKLLIIRTVKKV